MRRRREYDAEGATSSASRSPRPPRCWPSTTWTSPARCARSTSSWSSPRTRPRPRAARCSTTSGDITELLDRRRGPAHRPRAAPRAARGDPGDPHRLVADRRGPPRAAARRGRGAPQPVRLRVGALRRGARACWRSSSGRSRRRRRATAPVLEFASWPGGDMDGHPEVGADTVTRTIELHRRAALRMLRDRVARLARRFSHSERHVRRQRRAGARRWRATTRRCPRRPRPAAPAPASGSRCGPSWGSSSAGSINMLDGGGRARLRRAGRAACRPRARRRLAWAPSTSPTARCGDCCGRSTIFGFHLAGAGPAPERQRGATRRSGRCCRATRARRRTSASGCWRRRSRPGGPGCGGARGARRASWSPCWTPRRWPRRPMAAEVVRA